MLELAPDTKVIVLTGQNDRANAVRAIGLGAYDFFAKPFEPELLALTIDRALRLYDLQQENRRLQSMHQPNAFAGLITRDPALLQICRTIEKVAGTGATVLLLGESGTGKELLARALHDLSPRRSERFVAINCAAIPETLLESELFGYEKGAFTGAAKQTIGKIETANRGTLMLDEIGDLPLPLQSKLLRFLQERVIDRVGGREEIPIDVRVVCATHQDLKSLIREGRFREDLYYRLAEIVVEHSIRCGNDPATRRCWRTRSSSVLRRSSVADPCRCGPTRLRRSNRSHGPATCVNWKTACDARLSWPKATRSLPPTSDSRWPQRMIIRRSICARSATKRKSVPSSRRSAGRTGMLSRRRKCLA